MSKKKASPGNVEEGAEEVSTPQDFSPGDLVALTQAALRIDRVKDMTPRLIHAIGQDNEFLVLDVFDTEEHGTCLTLSPCCYKYKDRKTGKRRCTGHPSQYFEKKGRLDPTTKAGVKSSHLIMPILGELFRFNYDEEDPENPKFDGHVFGMSGSTAGLPAKVIKAFIEELKLM